jgi:Gram-negative bacterial tonB protein.
MKENKKYTAAEIARYHAGKMSVQEMHAIEKAALQDPFLADALEGYLHTPHFKDDLKDIQQRLAEKRKHKKVFSIFSIAGNSWWRVAALVIIIAGVGYFFYHSNEVKKDNLLTRNEPQATSEKADTITVNKDSAATSSVAFENSKAQTALNKKAAEGNSELIKVDKSKSPISLAGNNKKNKSFGDSSVRTEMNKENASEAANEYVLAGKLIDRQGKAVPFATITDKKSNTATVTDTAGNFFIRSQDSATTATASAAGYVSKNISLKRDEQPTIEMKKIDGESDQVVVTAMGVSKKAKAAAPELKALSGKVSGIQITTIYPFGGQEKFDQYLQKNLRPVYNENHERLTGEVHLSFTLNKKGQPENIRVAKSSCISCEKEAKRLLQDGPTWIGKKGDSGTVVIKF